MRDIELLAPAADKHVAMAAIMHGADAVYIGASSHGARHKAANSLDDLRETVDFAHQFRAKVYVTVNTLVFEHELPQVERLVWDLYRIGVDAIIVQDMSLLRLNLPPIPLHASTQCDNRTPAKARFLQNVGFSQIVLARELTVAEIREICRTVTIPVECFVHGALCVSYSGRCAASQTALGRSANRGKCAQMCRMPYTLRDADGNIIVKDKYLLSLRDFNAADNMEALLDAGVASFKIEGRLKDAAYVKNVTAFYRRRLDEIFAANPGKYRRSSYGESSFSFIPSPEKSFNRGFTSYFLSRRRPGSMASLLTPKSMGETIENVNDLHNGDGISFFNADGEYQGVNVNGIKDGRIIGSRPFRLPAGAVIHRTSDVVWQKLMAGDTARRTVRVDMALDENGLTLTDERGLEVRVAMDVTKDVARQPMSPERVLGKLGDTIYRLGDFKNNLEPTTFIPASGLAALRRRGVALLDAANKASYPFEYRRQEDLAATYPEERLTARDNVANSLARAFYSSHGVKDMEPSVELQSDYRGAVMTTRYCILRELKMCRKEHPDKAPSQPLTITTGPHSFRLAFDCARCEMSLFPKQ